MRVCLVSQEYPPDTAHGGIATQTYLKAHGLARLGHEVYVLTHSIDDGRHRDPDGPVQVRRIPGPDVRFEVREEAVRWLAHSEDVATALDELHEEVGFDLIDAPEYGGELFFYLLNRVGDQPRVTVHLHGPLAMLTHALGWPDTQSDLYRIGTLMESTTIRLADGVYSSSRLSARWCADRYGFDDRHTPVLHTGVDTRHFRPVDMPKHTRPTIAFLGKVGSSKGADVLVHAATVIADRVPDLRVKLYGPSVGDQGEALQREARERGYPHLVDLGGRLTKEQIPEALSRALVFAAPSPYEGGPGFVYLEAMACGLPVVAASGSGVDEIVNNGDNGILVPPGDVAALGEALYRLLTSPAERDAIGRRAREYAVSVADTSRCVAQIADYYEGVVRSDATPR